MKWIACESGYSEIRPRQLRRSAAEKLKRCWRRELCEGKEQLKVKIEPSHLYALASGADLAFLARSGLKTSHGAG